MKSKGKYKKSAKKRRIVRKKINRTPRLPGVPAKSLKNRTAKPRTGMSSKKLISKTNSKEENIIKLVKKLLGDESIDDIPGCEEKVNLLQDLDLLVLGSTAEEYKRYKELLRKEYSHLDDSRYKQMRLKNRVEPSTSQQAVITNGPGTSNTTIRRSKVPFVKFKDDVHHKKYKNRGKHKSSNQLACRKILHLARRRRSIRSTSNSNENVPSSGLQAMTIEPNVRRNKSNENEVSDDDCVCLEPQTEVIVIDDETLTPSGFTKANALHQSGPLLKEYIPISVKRLKENAFSRMITSTPKLKLLSDKTRSRVPSYSTLNRNSDCTLVEEKSDDNDIVFIDDSLNVSDSKLDKANRNNLQQASDESVIFVGENIAHPDRTSAALDFIPLETPQKESRFRIIPTHVPMQESKRPRHDLFTSKEQKELRQYNSNAYNPNKNDPPPLTRKRMVLVDGSNVAYNHALNKEFSVKGLKICLDYFEKMGHEVKAIVPQFRLQKQKSSDPEYLEKLHKEGKIVFTPCKSLPGKSSISYDDRFVLQLAAELDAAVVSNDNYRDLINENPAFKKIIENRVIGYTWCNDLFILPKDPYGKWGPTLGSILNRS